MEPQKLNREKLLSDYHSSNQTQKDWCAANNVNIKTLQNWLRRERKQAKEANHSPWVAVNVNTAAGPSAAAELILHTGKYSIELAPHCDLAFLCKVLRALEGV